MRDIIFLSLYIEIKNAFHLSFKKIQFLMIVSQGLLQISSIFKHKNQGLSDANTIMTSFFS